MLTTAAVKELANQIALHDGKAYEVLFCEYHPRLLQFAHSISHSREAAEEIVSDVFIKIWNKRQSLPEIENLHFYLYVSTKNQAINYLARQNREKTFSPDEVVVELRSIYYDPEQLLITAEMLRLLQHAISQLPPRCQLIFKLVKEDGLKYREVAELIGVSIKTVENQMTIALRKIDQSIQFDEQKSISSANKFK